MPAKPSASRSGTPGAAASAARNGTPANGRQIPAAAAGSAGSKGAEPKILFQKYFKSIGPRTYAAQLKEAGNGNHFLVLTEGKRDPVTNEVKKLKLFVYSEDFNAFFRMLHDTAQFIKAHPVSPEIKMRRMRYWAKKEAEQATAARVAAEAAAAGQAAKPARPVTPAKVTGKA